MAKIAARNARILFDNRNLSPDVNQATLTITAEAPEVTSFVDTYRVRMQDSMKDYEFSCDGFYNTSASTMDEIMSNALAGSGLAGIYFNGLGACNVGREFNSILSSYDQKFALADAAAVSFKLSGSSSLYSMKSLAGSSLNAQLTPKVSGVGSSTFGGVDLKGAADTSGSSYISLRVFDLSGTTPTFSASVEYSGNDTTYTTAASVLLVAPSNIGANSASLWKIEGASRYARVIITLGGTSPCATFMVAAGSIIR
jgi:hypothetical protein